MIHVWHRTGAYRQRTGRDLLGPWNLQVFIIICSTVLTISKCGTPRKTYRHRCEKKKQLKILQILLAKQKPHLASALRTFFRIISTFELIRKLATTILFLIDIPEQWGCRFQLCFTYSKTKSHDDVGTAGIFSQTWASPRADTAEGAVMCWGRLINQMTCVWKGSCNQNSFDSE